MIELRDVSKTYQIGKDNVVQAVRNVNVTIEPGDFAVITGRSGSGKTTLLNLAAGLTKPTAGHVKFDGVDVWQLPDAQQSAMRARSIGFIFQFPSLLPSLTALENVTLPTTFRAPDEARAVEATDRAAELLKSVGLSDKLKSYPRQLSAGQQQRVVIARALINSPKALLADEPTSNLDEQTEREIMELFRDIHAQRQITIVMVTHTTQLLQYGTRSIEMATGQIVTGRSN
ncbi:MAG: ABC transporter ATP-binding protein [Anaerolineae bacterium]